MEENKISEKEINIFKDKHDHTQGEGLYSKERT